FKKTHGLLVLESLSDLPRSIELILVAQPKIIPVNPGSGTEIHRITGFKGTANRQYEFEFNFAQLSPPLYFRLFALDSSVELLRPPVQQLKL
ncbi:MAG: hypothetical protein ABH878_08610, partial [bacterium]